MKKRESMVFASTILLYLNPISIYWYISIYKGSVETALSLCASMLLTMLIVALLIKFRTVQRRARLFVMGILGGLPISIVVLLISQLAFTDQLIGYAELGGALISTYVTLGLFIPTFWINGIAVLVTYFLVKSPSQGDSSQV